MRVTIPLNLNDKISRRGFGPKRLLVYILAIALMFSASMPKGYMLSRGADNVVEIVLCRGFGQESESLFLDISTGEYLEPQAQLSDGVSLLGSASLVGNVADHHSMGDPTDKPCEFTLAGLDGSEAKNSLSSNVFSATDIPEVLRRWDIVASSFQYPSPRGPPVHA